ncbi:hypothetical protein ONZ45_g9051 [Pleurotus djamor]|nr:hypothetical protein ONZ45_g9051 [Pleurotus djamor]
MFTMLKFIILTLLFATSTTISTTASALPPPPNADLSTPNPKIHAAEVINTGVTVVNLANANTHEKREPTPIEALNAVLDPVSGGIKNLRTAIGELSAEKPTPSQFEETGMLSEPDSRSVLSRFNVSAPLGRGSLRTLGSKRDVIESHFTRFGVAFVYGNLQRLKEDTSTMYEGFYLIFDGAVFQDAERLKVETVEMITAAANDFAPIKLPV